jgi:hypothetical protein
VTQNLPNLRTMIKRKGILTNKSSIFLICGLSYLLLYLLFSHDEMLFSLDWKDYQFHMRLIEILENQDRYIPVADGTPVPYPVFFHHVARAVSYSLNLKCEIAMLLVSCLTCLGFTFLVFLTVVEVSHDALAGLLGAIFLGVGANFVIFFSKTIFFGGIFIFPVEYLIAGYLPNLMGHFFGLLMLFIIIKSRLKKWYHVTSCMILGVLLVLSHLIAFVTYLIAVVCLFSYSYLSKEDMKVKQFWVILLSSIIVSGFWWVNIIHEVLDRSYLVFLSDAGQNWVNYGISSEVMRYYGFIPFFSILGIVCFWRKHEIGNFLSLWLLLLLPFLFSIWGFRFALELAVPLYMLGAVGVSKIFRQVVLEKRMPGAIRCIVLLGMIYSICEIFRLFDLLRISLFPVLL